MTRTVKISVALATAVLGCAAGSLSTLGRRSRLRAQFRWRVRQSLISDAGKEENLGSRLWRRAQERFCRPKIYEIAHGSPATIVSRQENFIEPQRLTARQRKRARPGTLVVDGG